MILFRTFWVFLIIVFSADEAGPSGVGDYADQDENDEDAVQVQFLTLPGRLENVRCVRSISQLGIQKLF